MTTSDPVHVSDEQQLTALAVALGAERVEGFSDAESMLLTDLPPVLPGLEDEFRQKILSGSDPLGDTFCALRSPEARRPAGAVFTPSNIVKSMLNWAETVESPERVVDPGAGSATFLLAAGRRFPNAQLIAVETDPLAALLARANLAVSGMDQRSEVRLEDFRRSRFEVIDGRTLYVGNPPYVRHHLQPQNWKRWLKNVAGHFDLKASTLAGLHVYFFLAIARWAKDGDYGALITSAEWLDVNYGKLVRELFMGRLGGQSISVIEPEAQPFPGTLTTAAITTFAINTSPSAARFSRIANLEELSDLGNGKPVLRHRLVAASRWSHFTRKSKPVPSGHVELGELCRVHRGQVTGANRIWFAGDHAEALPDESLYSTVTRASELFQAGSELTSKKDLKRVVDLPADLSYFSGEERKTVDQFLLWATEMGARDSFVAQNRRAWWSVGLRQPAPILATYMARRPPTFVLNVCEARHVNIAHGLYPRESMDAPVLKALADYLRSNATTDGGRVYAGGLTKFEPREMERIPVPSPEMLAEIVH